MTDYVCNIDEMIVAADGVAAAAVSTDAAATAELQTADATTAAAEINAAAPLPLLMLILPLSLLRLLLPLPLLALHVGLTHSGYSWRRWMSLKPPNITTQSYGVHVAEYCSMLAVIRVGKFAPADTARWNLIIRPHQLCDKPCDVL
jgi:hypothetical protein